MIINSSFVSYSPKYFKQQQKNNNIVVQNPVMTKVPFETLKAYSFGVSVKKREDIYSNTYKFAEYFEDKLKKQMEVKSVEDIQNIVDNTVKETDASEIEVCEVLSRVTQFADYSSIDALELSLREKGYDSCENQFYGPLSLSMPLNYLSKRNQFMNKPKGRLRTNNAVQFIDNSVLDHMQTLDKLTSKHHNYKQHLKSAVIVDGWNTKIDGKNMAYTMFGSEYDLQTITTSIVKEMQKTGKSLDEVLNGDIINRLKDIMGDNYEPTIIKSIDEPVYGVSGIANLMQPKMPTKEQIITFVDVIADTCAKDGLDPNIVKPLICKYLDVTFEAFSSARINSELKRMHKLIENKVKSLGKTMDDVVYLYPSRNKSFSLISYQYALANNIPFDKFKEEVGTSPSLIKKHTNEKDKVYVILDDVAASGESLYDSQFSYLSFIDSIEQDKNTNVIFAPLHTSDIGKGFLEGVFENQHRDGIDFVLSNQVKGWGTNLKDHFTSEEISLMNQIVGGKGFNDVGTSVVFPFCITDSDTRLSALFSTFFVRYPNEQEISSKITEGWEYKTPFFKMTREIGSYNEYNPKFI